MSLGMRFETRLERDPAEAAKLYVIGKLVAYNDSQAAEEGASELAVFTRCDGELVGGLLGFTHWNWLFVKQLWVCDRVRGKGLGTKLMQAAESEAVSRSCLHAHLDTFDFQALPFYEKQGYRLFGQLEDYPVGHTRYFLQKRDLT